MNDLISIIVPVYRQKNDYLKQCIDSLINQTYLNVEIIVVNDGMSKENLELISGYNSIKIVGEHNQGVSAARNLGIQESTGDWIIFVDSDDYLDTKFCETMLEKAKSYNVDLVTSSLVRKYSIKEEKILCVNNDTLYNQSIFLDKLLNVQNNLGYMWGKLWKASVIKDNKVKVNETLVVAEDASFCVAALSFINNVLVISECLYFYRMNEKSVTKKYDSYYYLKYKEAMYSLKKQLVKYDRKYQQGFYNFVAYHLLMICVNYFFNNENSLSYKAQKKVLKDGLKDKLFFESLKKSNYKDLSFSRKISLFVLKHKLYLFLKIICNIRNKQNRT